MRLIRRKESRGEVSVESLGEVAPSGDDSAEELGIQTAQSVELRRQISRLPARCRELLTKLYLDELAYEEISESMNLPIGSIGPTRARCLTKLRASLDLSLFS